MTEFSAAMRKAANLTRAYNLVEATRVIQDALAGRRSAARAEEGTTPAIPLLPKPATDPATSGEDTAALTPATASHAPSVDWQAKPRRPLEETVRLLREGRLHVAPLEFKARARRPQIEVPAGAKYLTRSFSSAAGTRSYRLYVPATMKDGPQGMILMLHGCSQNPDDFAAGTAMNKLAEVHDLLIVYPGQTTANNPASCWNWFRSTDQVRGQGEPAILAGMARELALEFNIGREQTFIAGLSAGGAMAMVMAETYPELFAAAGIHSGLDYKSASDVASALAAMRGSHSPSATSRFAEVPVRMIVFHGASDSTVHPSNSDRIAARVGSSMKDQALSRTARGAGYTRTTFGPDNAPLLEKWSVDHLGHAWSGGSAAGSFTDQRGPDASAEMVRFFLRRDWSQT
jgi:poly(hydroxyalkanoate) depolymerase family esterase